MSLPLLGLLAMPGRFAYSGVRCVTCRELRPVYAILISAIAFLAIFGGALAGVWGARYLPPPHLTAETRAAVSVSMAVVGTLAALVLSLMITNASSTFTAKGDAVASLAVEIVKLDRTLRRYGSETGPAREALRTYAQKKVADLSQASFGQIGVSTLELLEVVDDRILALRSNEDRQTHLKGDALGLIHAISDSRWTLVAKSEGAVSSPFLSLLILWLALLFASFGLFAPRNATVMVVLFLSGLAISAGIFMIIELGSATAGLVRISTEPLSEALVELARPTGSPEGT